MNQNITVIDVRTPAEFEGGNVPGSINIPLQEFQARFAEVKAISNPIVFCCSSGGRSGQATAYSRQFGINCENGGSWFMVKSQLNL